MNSFIKLLNIARQNINAKKRSKREIIPFEENKIIKFDEKKKTYIEENDDKFSGNIKLNKCDIYIENIDFIPEFKLEQNNNNLVPKILIEGIKEKTILSLLEDKKYAFQNSLVKSNLFKSKMDKYKNFGDDKEIKIVSFNKVINVDKKKFNDGQKKINFNEDACAEVDFNKERINNLKYKLLIDLGNNRFFTPLAINEYLSDNKFNILELPLYKEDDEDNIYACMEIYVLEKDLNDKRTIKEIYEEINQKYLREPLLIFKDYNNIIDTPSKNDRFGLYEPNVYRRRILNLIHNKKNINVDPVNLNNYEEENLNKLYQVLYNQCAILPPMSNFQYFKISNLKRNNDINDINNSYRRRLGLKLLKIQRHEKFMQKYGKNRWDKYIKDLAKGKEEGEEPIKFLERIPDKRYLLKYKDKADNLNSLMYLGVPKEYRERVYSLLLDLPKIHEKTRTKIYEKFKKDLQMPNQIYSFFANQLYDDKSKRNIIFSLIDNDSNFLSSAENSTLDEINKIKKIAKAFFKWAELKIGLDDEKDKYVYFIGLLTLTQQLFQNFKQEYFTFWVLIGLAKNITHFHQKNPLFSDELNYINIFGLVTKLIMERHQKKIFDKFISLNIPPELFLTKHLSTLFTDYFKGELMMRILDIIVFESSMKDLYTDKMQYLRVLCAIPLTLFEFSEEKILACKSVSEIESITNDLFLHTFNRNKFISRLENNLNKFYVVSNFLERWFFNNKGREWDSKRGDLENLIKRHFYPVYEENKNYLHEISSILKNNSQDIINNVFDNLDNKLSTIKSLYLQGTNDFDDSNSFMGINILITKLKQIYNNENYDHNEYKLIISFGDIADQQSSKYGRDDLNINFDSKNNEIINIKDLYYNEQFKNDQSPKYIHFTLSENNNIKIANFSYKILNFKPMKISKISLENQDETNKFFLEFILFKYNTKPISTDDLALYNNIFSPPEYYNSKKIEEKLFSYDISNYHFNNEIGKLIEEENNIKDKIIENPGFDQNMKEIFKRLNDNEKNEDGFNFERIINRQKNNDFNELISQKILKIIEISLSEDVSNIIKKWLGETNISFEEILYGIILVDKSIISVNEKLYLLFLIAQLRDKLLLNTDDISIEKLKEMIYSLYKRFRIYFSKSDIERMIDFLLKDERLFNIKYAFVHDKKDTEKINEIMNDKDYYEPKDKENKKDFEILFEDISKELNLFINYLNNHYNINDFSSNLISYIFTQILNKKELKKYSNYNFNTITLLIEKDNIIDKRIYNISYSPLKIVEEKSNLDSIKPKDQNDITNIVLIQEISNININNSYNLTNYISFDKFKEIFFKLPYLSDLFRVCFSYLSINKNTEEKEFDSFKVTVGYENYSLGTFHFPNKIDNEEEINEHNNANINYDMDKKVKISDTVDSIISKIINKIKNNKIKIKNEEQAIIDYLVSIHKIKCSIYYDIDGFKSGRLMQENIGYFDSLYSCIELKNKNSAEIRITFDNDLVSFNSNKKIVEKEDGYCKIYLSNNDDFIWKKCKVKRKKMDKVKLVSSDYKSSPRILNKDEDVILAYDI